MRSLSSQINESLTERFLTTSDLKRVAADIKQHADDVIKNTSEDIKSQIIKYVETNDKKLLYSIFDAIAADAELSDVVNKHNHNIRKVWRGIHLDTDDTESNIKDTELHSEFVAATSDRLLAEKYAKGDESSFDNDTDGQSAFLITYETQPECVFLDIDLFKSVLPDDIASEIIISPKLASNMTVKKLT